jgi:hypothetical protein
MAPWRAETCCHDYNIILTKYWIKISCVYWRFATYDYWLMLIKPDCIKTKIFAHSKPFIAFQVFRVVSSWEYSAVKTGAVRGGNNQRHLWMSSKLLWALADWGTALSSFVLWQTCVRSVKWMLLIENVHNPCQLQNADRFLIQISYRERNQSQSYPKSTPNWQKTTKCTIHCMTNVT